MDLELVHLPQYQYSQKFLPCSNEYLSLIKKAAKAGTLPHIRLVRTGETHNLFTKGESESGFIEGKSVVKLQIELELVGKNETESEE